MNSQTYDFSAINDRISLANEGRVTGSFRDYAITSAFQPIFSLSHSDPVGYEARCRARSADGLAVSRFVLFGQGKARLIMCCSIDYAARLMCKISQPVQIKNHGYF